MIIWGEETEPLFSLSLFSIFSIYFFVFIWFLGGFLVGEGGANAPSAPLWIRQWSRCRNNCSSLGRGGSFHCKIHITQFLRLYFTTFISMCPIRCSITICIYLHPPYQNLKRKGKNSPKAIWNILVVTYNFQNIYVWVFSILIVILKTLNLQKTDM